MWTEVFRKRWKAILIGATGGTILAIAGVYLQNDLHRNALDPKVPFQIYQATRLPKAPDYRKAAGWYLNPALSRYYADPRKVDVFFLHGTTFDGGKDWLGGINGPATRDVERVQIPNYAGPFSVMGNVYAPRYRQASLYTQLTGRDDAREARRFAYGDAEAAFQAFLKQRRGGRGFIIVGVEQGGLLVERLLRDEVASKPDVRSQLVAAYMLETLAPEALFDAPGSIPVCRARDATGCAVSYLSVDAGRPDQALQLLKRAVAWEGNNDLVTLGADKAVCVNPLIGAPKTGEVDAHRSQGATNATGLEWGTEPALLLRKVSARCLSGLLIVDKPDSPTFRDGPAWVDQRKVNPYNLFYGDLQADMQ